MRSDIAFAARRRPFSAAAFHHAQLARVALVVRRPLPPADVDGILAARRLEVL